MEITNRTLNRLSEIGAIVIHQSTDSEFIEIVDYEEGNYRYYPYKVKWALNVKSNELNKVPLVESIINSSNILLRSG